MMWLPCIISVLQMRKLRTTTMKLSNLPKIQWAAIHIYTIQPQSLLLQSLLKTVMCYLIYSSQKLSKLVTIRQALVPSSHIPDTLTFSTWNNWSYEGWVIFPDHTVGHMILDIKKSPFDGKSHILNYWNVAPPLVHLTHTDFRFSEGRHKYIDKSSFH